MQKHYIVSPINGPAGAIITHPDGTTARYLPGARIPEECIAVMGLGGLTSALASGMLQEVGDHLPAQLGRRCFDLLTLAQLQTLIVEGYSYPPEKAPDDLNEARRLALKLASPRPVPGAGRIVTAGAVADDLRAIDRDNARRVYDAEARLQDDASRVPGEPLDDVPLRGTAAGPFARADGIAGAEPASGEPEAQPEAQPEPEAEPEAEDEAEDELDDAALDGPAIEGDLSSALARLKRTELVEAIEAINAEVANGHRPGPELSTKGKREDLITSILSAQ